MGRAWVAAAVVTAGLLAVWAPAGAAEAQVKADTLTVSGTGEVRVAPDRAMVSLGVETRAPTAAAAISQNNATMTKVAEAIRRLGIPERNIQTATFNVNRQYEPLPPNSNRQPTPVYVVTNVVSVLLEDPSRAGAVIDAGTGAGANQVEGVSFYNEREAESYQQALRSAVQDAQGKAQAMAQALGVRLAGVQSIDESGGQVVLPKMRAAAMQAEAATPIFAGENTIRANVTIVYRIAQ